MAEEKIAMSERYRRMLEARKPLKKVFGKLELAAKCNDDECAFFRKHMV